MTLYTGPQPTMPMIYGPVPPAPRRATRRTAVTLAVVAVTLLLTSGVFAGLYVMASGQRDATAERLDERRIELAGLTDERAELTQVRDDATRRNAELENTRTELAECVDAVRHYLWDDLAGAELNTALEKMFALCQ